MTTPPPSETGPSAAEEQREIVRMAARIASECGFTVRYDAKLTEALLREVPVLIVAAKRLAHLEDARAGCTHCGQGLVPVHDVVDGWVHDEDGADCERPEVWDALSLPPGKPSGTIKSTASEQPDGKTR